MLTYLIENKEWIFSGIGVFAISFFIVRKRKDRTMYQKSGDGSKNLQAGRDIKIDKNDMD
ncbi:hypothetical protein [Pseudomonas sp. EA_65y_Pfl2_P74]|uniref:hypothetical protein n=1 Tax=Pseudomonas sp. EA_65y_Pfl2_P74 TaxID=3088694 RepID=UPI0030DA340D